MKTDQNGLKKKFSELSRKLIYWALSFCLLFSLLFTSAAPTFADGTRELGTNGGKRALTEWRTGKTVTFLRRTLLEVYAKAGETLYLGSSGVDVLPFAGGSTVLSDIVVWNPGVISDKQAVSLPSPSFSCKSDQPGKGKLTTRTQELAGPLPNVNGYDPCVFVVPATGVYSIAIYGPDGPSGNNDGEAGTIDAPDITSAQRSGVSMWDITVRDSVGTEKPGRVFSDYLALNTGGNGVGYRMNSTLYVVSKDGYKYQVDLRGLDPYGFIFYGNSVGYYHPDGKTPLYHDLVATENSLATPLGGVKIAPPSAKIFFDVPASDIPSSLIPAPQLPTISNISFVGTAHDNISNFSTGGEFHYTGNVGGIAEVVISQDRLNYAPNNPNNRVLRAEKTSGDQYLHWDGKANNGVPFPVSDDPYPFKVFLHGGEFHFPMLDVENSQLGGPTITLLNPPGGLCLFDSCSTAFYDDRGYQTSVGTVGTVNVILPGDTNAVNPPVEGHSNMASGFDTSTAQRAFGNGTNKGFGNWKGLDLWTYFPSSIVIEDLFVVDQPMQDLRLAKLHSGFFSYGPKGGKFLFQVSNVGTTTVADSVTLVDTLPSMLTPVSAAGVDWTCDVNGQVVTCEHLNTAGLLSGEKLPDVTVEVDVLSGPHTVINTATISNVNDSFPPNNTSSDPVRISSPTAVTLASFRAEKMLTLGVRLQWETASEFDVVGFNILRRSASEQDFEQINATFIPSKEPGSMVGAMYTWLDTDLEAGVTYYYMLEAMDIHGQTQVHGPVPVSVDVPLINRLFLPLVRLFGG
jgi:hypothetical protein